jgi:hypothetical protein
MIHSLARVSSKIIEVSFDYVFEIMKRKSHGLLEGFSDIFSGRKAFSGMKMCPKDI